MTPIMRESNATSALHWLSGGRPWNAMLGNPGIYVPDVYVRLGRASKEDLKESTWHPLHSYVPVTLFESVPYLVTPVIPSSL